MTLDHLVKASARIKALLMVIHKKMIMPGQPWIELSEYHLFLTRREAFIYCLFIGSNYVERIITRFLEEKYVAGPLRVGEGGLTLCLGENPPPEWRLNTIRTIGPARCDND